MTDLQCDITILCIQLVMNLALIWWVKHEVKKK